LSNKDVIAFIQLLDLVKPERINNYQEIIFNVFRVITNIDFNQNINLIREKRKIPIDWYMGNKHFNSFQNYLDLIFVQKETESDLTHSILKKYYDEHRAWCNITEEALVSEQDPDIFNLCNSFYLDYEIYRSFIFHFIYFGTVTENIFLNVKFLPDKSNYYKARLIFDSSLPSTTLESGLFIQIFRNTEPKDIRGLLKENETLIKQIQNNLDDISVNRFPGPKRFIDSLRGYLYWLIRGSHYIKDLKTFHSEIYEYSDYTNISRDVSLFRKYVHQSSNA
jgi:hypothetical protein